MTPPKLYEAFDRNSAIAAFGVEEQARTLCDGQWVIWPDVAVCLAEIGDAPKKSHFSSGTTFAWVAEKPYRVSTDSHSSFVPAEVVGAKGLKRKIWLFARPAQIGGYRFIGQIQSSHSQRSGGNENHGEALFDFHPLLPSEVWTQLGGLVRGGLDHTAVDTGLSTLEASETAAERLEVLKTLVRYWHGEITTDDGLSEDELSGIELPPVLRWWYRYAGRREKILSGQNMLLDRASLKSTPEGMLVFCGENQWCYEWATSLDRDDPHVFGRERAPQPWKPEGIKLSEHLILACLFEGTMCHCPYGAAAAELKGDVLSQIIEQIPPIASNGWNWCQKTRFYVGRGAFMFTMCNGEIDGQMKYSVWIGAKTEKPLQFLKPMLDNDWEYVSV